MAAPFTGGYGDFFSISSSELAGQNQVLTQWSAEVLRLGMDLLVFPRFLDAVNVMGKQKGDTWRVPVFLWNESTDATTALVAGTTILIDTQGTNNIFGTLDEYGRGMGYELTIEYYTKIGINNEVVMTLANNRARVMNELARAIFQVNDHVVFSGIIGTVGTATGTTVFNVGDLTAGTGDNAANGSLTSSVIKDLRDGLKGRRVAVFPNSLYVIVGNAAMFRTLKDEGVFETYSYYNNTSFGLNGIVYQILGNWEGFTFVETEEGVPSNVAYAFGRNVGGQAFAKPVQLFYYPDYNSDAGRLNVYKWHMIAGFAESLRQIGTTAVRVETSS